MAEIEGSGGGAIRRLWRTCRRSGGSIRKLWRTCGGGYYALLAAGTFVYLEAQSVVESVSEAEGVGDFIRSEIIETIITLGIETCLNTLFASVWPLYVGQLDGVDVGVGVGGGRLRRVDRRLQLDTGAARGTLPEGAGAIGRGCTRDSQTPPTLSSTPSVRHHLRQLLEEARDCHAST